MKAYKKGLRRHQIGLDRVLRRIERKLFKSLTRELNKDFDDLGTLAKKVFLQRAPLLDLSPLPTKGLKAQEENQAAKVVIAMDVDSWVEKKLRKTLERHATRSYTQVREAINDTLQIQADPFATMERSIVKDLGTRKGLADIEGGTREAIVRAIGQGRAEGMATDQIADLIKREVPKGRFVNAGKKYRSEMIARTETRYAVNESSMKLYRNAHEIVAVVAIDGEDDDECRERNGTQYTFDEADAENAKTHPNCTLRFVPVVTG